MALLMVLKFGQFANELRRCTPHHEDLTSVDIDSAMLSSMVYLEDLAAEVES